MDREFNAAYCGGIGAQIMRIDNGLRMSQQQDNSHVDDAAIEWAMEVAGERKATLRGMKEALLAGRWVDALSHACTLTGIEPADALKEFQDPQTGCDPVPKHTTRHVM